MPKDPFPATKQAFPFWAKTVIAVSGVLAGFAWLASWGVYAVATAPSASPSENMNGLVIIVLPYTLVPASALTTTAPLVGFAYCHSRSAKTVTLALSAMILAASCAGLHYYSAVTSP